MKILVIGSGGREHALAHTFKRQGHHVLCIKGNAGTKALCDPLPAKYEHIDPMDFNAVANLAIEMNVDLTVIGPELPLEMGIVDTLEKHGLKAFGPTQKASILECSKSWSKNFMTRHHIPTARYITSHDSYKAKEFANKNFYGWNGIVIKAVGLTAGKGVYVCETPKDAENAITSIMDAKTFGASGDEVVIEELLIGTEVSIMTFCDGNTITPMITAQDHKRLYDNNQGPNTGGVGAYTPTPFLNDSLMDDIKETVFKPTIEGLKKEGIHYKGFLYFGLMLTDQGPKVLEYNCRFGDPEAQVILPLLKTDLASIMVACCNEKLDSINIEWSPQAACCVVMVSRGYPKVFQTGYEIEGIKEAEKDESVFIFQGGTRLDEEGKTVTAGGRVLGVTALANDLEEAIKKSYEAVNKISFEGAYYRSDIGHERHANRSLYCSQ